MSSCLSVTMTPDPQESQGFGTPVLGMGGWRWERPDIFFITPHKDKEEVLKTRREKQPVTYQGTPPPPPPPSKIRSWLSEETMKARGSGITYSKYSMKKLTNTNPISNKAISHK